MEKTVNNVVEVNETMEINEETMALPTSDEYKDIAKKNVINAIGEYSQPKYQCPECGGEMYKDKTIYTAIPVQYAYNCEDCGHTENQLV